MEILMLSNFCSTHFLIENNYSHSERALHSGSVCVYFHEYYKASLDITMVPELGAKKCKRCKERPSSVGKNKNHITRDLGHRVFLPQLGF